MFERMLLPLDGSEQSEAALPYGEELAGRLGSDIILFHVRGRDHGPGYEHVHQLYLDRLAENIQGNVRRSGPQGAKVNVTTMIQAGEPGTTVCDLVQQNDVGLIVMSVVSAGLNVGKVLGSVADYVCRTVPVPVLLVRPQYLPHIEPGRPLINRILLTTDGSELSKLAIPVAQELAARLPASVSLFQMAHIVRPVDDGSGESAFVDYGKLNDEEITRVRDEMTVLQGQLQKAGLDVSHVVTSGFDAASAIIEVSKKVGADLVVMSTHGRSGLGRWVFGNVAEKVLRHGETPLLLVHARAR